MKMKALYSVALMVAASFVLLVISVHASTMDDSIESSAKKSYVFITYLQGDDIKIHSKDGVVSLTGTVSEESHKSLAHEKDLVTKLANDVAGVSSVKNQMIIEEPK